MYKKLFPGDYNSDHYTPTIQELKLSLKLKCPH